MEQQTTTPPESHRPTERTEGGAPQHAEARHSAPPPAPAQYPAPSVGQYPAPPTPPRTPYHKSPLLAAFLSIVPGLGNIYNGLYLRALTFSALCVGLFALAVAEGEGPQLGLIIPALIFFWLFNLVDSYRQATLINYGYAPESELAETLRAQRQGSGGLLLGAAIFALGLYGLLKHLFPEIDLSVVADYWYLLFLAFGGWLIYQAVRDRQRSEEAAGELDDSVEEESEAA